MPDGMEQTITAISKTKQLSNYKKAKTQTIVCPNTRS